ncbi:MAG: helix-turn-helix domain-containing protein [Clostridia bacterium]
MDEIDLKIENGKKFIRDRITQLRLKADISEYQLSYELGQNRGYIQAISSGKSMPSMAGFLNICDFFNITPLEFFDTSIEEPQLINDIIMLIKQMKEEDLLLLKEVLARISDK